MKLTGKLKNPAAILVYRSASKAVTLVSLTANTEVAPYCVSTVGVSVAKVQTFITAFVFI